MPLENVKALMDAMEKYATYYPNNSLRFAHGAYDYTRWLFREPPQGTLFVVVYNEEE